jgi:hypothetical protein
MVARAARQYSRVVATQLVDAAIRDFSAHGSDRSWRPCTEKTEPSFPTSEVDQITQEGAQPKSIYRQQFASARRRPVSTPCCSLSPAS